MFLEGFFLAVVHFDGRGRPSNQAQLHVRDYFLQLRLLVLLLAQFALLLSEHSLEGFFVNRVGVGEVLFSPAGFRDFMKVWPILVQDLYFVALHFQLFQQISH